MGFHPRKPPGSFSQEVQLWSHSCQTGDVVTLKPHETGDTSCIPQMILSDDCLNDIVWPPAVSHYHTLQYMPMVLQAGTGISRIVLNKVCRRDRGRILRADTSIPATWDLWQLGSMTAPGLSKATFYRCQTGSGCCIYHAPFIFKSEKARHIQHRC